MRNLLFLATFGTIIGWFCTLAIADTDVTIPDPEIQFYGTVVTRACNIDPQSVDQVVDMDTVIVKTLYRNGRDRAWPFFINLTDCKITTYKTVTVTFTGTEDSELTGKLAVNNGANGVAIALLDEKGTDLNLGIPTSTSNLSNGSNTLKFSAYVQGRPSAIKSKSITEGSFSSVANFIISYQ